MQFMSLNGLLLYQLGRDLMEKLPKKYDECPFNTPFWQLLELQVNACVMKWALSKINLIADVFREVLNSEYVPMSQNL